MQLKMVIEAKGEDGTACLLWLAADTMWTGLSTRVIDYVA